MEPSSSNAGLRAGYWLWLDRVVLAGLTIGLSGYVIPLWADGRLLWSFWITLSCTLLHLFTSRRSQRGDVHA